MRQLSPAGLNAVSDIAQRHGFSQDAVVHMLDAVIQGGGSMAQFNAPEFGGSGQWMRGGMIMLSDMFNNYLKGRVDTLCNELSNLSANDPGLYQAPQHQTQNQNGPVSLFVPAPGGGYGDWWGGDFGPVTSSGSQNNSRYAYFAGACRLAVEVNGVVTVYNTLDHQIGGVGQQQSWGGSMTFTSQYGLVDVASLPVVSIDGQTPYAPEPVYTAPPFPAPPPAAPSFPSLGGGDDVFNAIEKLADLRSRGILTDNEFAAKKAELLSRL